MDYLSDRDLLRRLVRVRAALFGLIDEAPFREARMTEEAESDESPDDLPGKTGEIIEVFGRGHHSYYLLVPSNKRDLFMALETAIFRVFNLARSLRAIRLGMGDPQILNRIIRLDLFELGKSCGLLGLKLEQWENTSKGARKTNAGTAEIYSAMHPEIKARVDEIMATGKAFTPATNAVAIEYNVSGRYVRNVYGPNPAPRNKGGKR